MFRLHEKVEIIHNMNNVFTLKTLSNVETFVNATSEMQIKCSVSTEKRTLSGMVYKKNRHKLGKPWENYGGKEVKSGSASSSLHTNLLPVFFGGILFDQSHVY